MKRNRRWAVMVVVVCGLALARCTGGQEGSASEEYVEPKHVAQEPQKDPVQVLRAINPAIPVYQGAAYRADLSRRDEATYRNQYGAGTEVYTLATQDSFPQVWHYYVTYLAQYRAFEPQPPYPPQHQSWRTIEIPLNQVMQDPFIPGTALQGAPKNVILQIAETEAEPATVIRYVLTPASIPPPVSAVATNAAPGKAGAPTAEDVSAGADEPASTPAQGAPVQAGAPDPHGGGPATPHPTMR